MPTLREFFVTEATDVLGQLAKLVQRLDGGSGQFAELQRLSRAMRGAAQMAREDRVYRASVSLEAAAKVIATGALGWSEDLSSRVRLTMEDIEALVRANEAEDVSEQRVRRSLDRWREVGIAIPDETETHPTQVSEASRQFRQFAAHEVGGIVAEMEVSLETLAADPRNRDPLKAILRRQRALLGAARLDEIGVVAEALRATEDMTRVIAKLNVPVKEEWLSVFRSARDVLRSSLEQLQRGETPIPTPAISKLRTLRQELLERYGEVEPAGQPATRSAPAPAPAPRPAPAPQPAPGSAAKPAPTPPPPPAPATAPSNAVAIDQFLYRGEAALKRALELKPQLEQLSAGNAAARESLEEVFDLIRLALA